MKLSVDKIEIVSVVDNIATLVMTVSYLMDDGTTLETAPFSTTYNILVDGEKEGAIERLNAEADKKLQTMPVREAFAVNDAPAVVSASQATLDTAMSAVKGISTKAVAL